MKISVVGILKQITLCVAKLVHRSRFPGNPFIQIPKNRVDQTRTVKTDCEIFSPEKAFMTAVLIKVSLHLETNIQIIDEAPNLCSM